MFDQLTRPERLRLLKFVCSFAWADLEVNEAERAHVERLVRRLDLGPTEIDLVEGWLRHPPPPEEIDPLDVPVAHRQVFLDAVLAVSAADGDLDPAEAECFNLLSQLVR